MPFSWSFGSQTLSLSLLFASAQGWRRRFRLFMPKVIIRLVTFGSNDLSCESATCRWECLKLGWAFLQEENWKWGKNWIKQNHGELREREREPAERESESERQGPRRERYSQIHNLTVWVERVKGREGIGGGVGVRKEKRGRLERESREGGRERCQT